MCATAAKSVTELKTKTTKPKTKTKKSQSAQAEANRRNSRKSSGPKTDEGKSKSRFNALKHGMTAQTVLLPGDDGHAFANRLRYLLDDLQPRNSLEGVVIERLAGDLWKADRAEGSGGARINFRLRHEPVDQVLKDRHEAIELGQHLLWQPAWPLPVGLNEGEAKGAVAKFPLADLPGDPLHPARLLLNLESTVAGCDWLLGRWGDLRFQLEIPGRWTMADVWKMVRLLGKTAIEVKDNYQVALLVLASMALEPEPGRPAMAEAGRTMTQNDGLSRVVAGITRLCEPFQQALARMPLDKLAPENQEQARQRLIAVVEQEEGRIGRIRAMLQKIAEADLAEAPVRLAFETGTEGDRGRRYILSYERLVNRRIDTFLKVRKASGSGELDLVELANQIDPGELAQLVAAAGKSTSQDPGDLRSGDGRGRETVTQRPEPDALGESTSVSQLPITTCGDDLILRNEANDAPEDPGGWGRHPQGDAPRSEAAGPGARWTSQLDPSHPTFVTGQRVDLEPSPQVETTAAPAEPTGTCLEENTAIIAVETVLAATRSEDRSAALCVCRGGDDDMADPCGEQPYSIRATIEQPPMLTPCEQAACNDDPILRNEAIAAPGDSPNLESEVSIGPAARVASDSQEELTAENLDNRTTDVNEPVTADEGNTRGDEPKVPLAAVPPPAMRTLAELLVPMDKAALALLTKAELEARRWAMFQAQRQHERRQRASYASDHVS